MARGGVIKKDWVFALVIVIAFVVAMLAGLPFIDRLELLSYDAGVQMTPRVPGATDRIALVAIDDASMARLGPWPWPRSVLAAAINRLEQAGAKVIGLQLFLTEPQTDPGLSYIRQFADLVAGTRFSRSDRSAQLRMLALLKQAEGGLDTDAKLAQALAQTHNVVMPMRFTLGAPVGRPPQPLPDYVLRNRLSRVTKNDMPAAPLTAVRASYPLPEFGQYSTGIGHLDLTPDADGGVRSDPLVIDYYGDYYPSLALELAAQSLNLAPGQIAVHLGQGVRLGRLYIKTGPSMRMYSGFYRDHDGKPAFATYSFYDVESGKVPASAFRNKIVIIGPTAAGIGSRFATPVATSMPGPEITANIVAGILNQDFYTQAAWAPWAEAGLLAVIALYLMLILPNIGPALAASISFVLFVGLIISGQYLLISERLWLHTVSPALLLLIGHLAITSKRFFTSERRARQVEADSAQTDRLLGLTYQNQGQLDMAMDKFRRLPADKSVLELIYNLALDFERKRQFGKAAVAYDYIMEHNPRFRDVQKRKKRAQQADNAMMLGGRAVSPGGTLILDGMDQKPTLGRYEIERELGKGAMGTVYLGRDPKINRVVAIKTLALSEEFEAGELERVTERFFREAETAGRLNHPNIVTIYDAGEDQDLAYIAMEYLQGKDLTHYISGKPLAVDWVLEITAKVADALSYAHRQDVVHRDIKPANIMYNEADNSVKVTDFGIARITASSRTKTGLVLGTPSYMSPEQLAGRHVDGRSDLFSLGVTLFELLTGVQPFGGDTMAALMYQITNAKHPDITGMRRGLAPCVRTIIDRALQKDPAKRFQTGEEFKQALVKCLAGAAESRSRAR